MLPELEHLRRNDLKPDDWFYQNPRCGLGDFVLKTPMLQGLAQKLGHKILVYFGTEKIAALYSECPFINILTVMPSKQPFFCSGANHYRGHTNLRTPWKFYKELNLGVSEMDYYIFVDEDLSLMPNTYVDRKITMELPRVPGRKHVALIHGCNTRRRAAMNNKIIAPDILKHARQAIIDRGMVPVILGADSDRRWFKGVDFKGCMNYLGTSLVDAVSLLYQCDAFIANDTGLSHVGGALDKTGLVLWKRTNYLMYHMRSKQIQYSMHHHGKNINLFLDALR